MGLLGALGQAVKRRLIAAFTKPLIRMQYEYLSKIDEEAEVTFLNYGYEDADAPAPELPLEDEPNRFAIQLYHHLAEAVDLEGLDVLEVGCGRGGGAAFIKRHHKARTVMGVDFCRGAVDFCKQTYQEPGLRFSLGDAEDLKFEDASFDVVVNVESSHCYNALSPFLDGVFRVLKPGGHFLYTDFRNRDRVDRLAARLRETDASMVREWDITDRVLASLDLDQERKLDLIHRVVPEQKQDAVKVFAGIRGTTVYEGFKSGDIRYLSFVLQKAER
ncbi:MAG: class I SAM-dependent methyltransferase [bacterium]|nr:class I SAM-dependent methyltransferase [bacterium]